MEGRLIFITGGARSGKSTFAEQYAMKLNDKTNQALIYLATSNKEDGEMDDRIKRHQRDRDNSGYVWHTIEKPNSLMEIPANEIKDKIVLLDCLTLWLTNELFRHGFGEERWNDLAYQEAVQSDMLAAASYLAREAHTLILVSNEVNADLSEMGQSVVNIYGKVLGMLHQQFVEDAREAYMIESGIPILKKGRGALL